MDDWDCLDYLDGVHGYPAVGVGPVAMADRNVAGVDCMYCNFLIEWTNVPSLLVMVGKKMKAVDWQVVGDDADEDDVVAAAVDKGDNY